ncbi:MAG: SufD family Fe-S cluster assembly protein [Eubacterium sp.]|nr:SufD family Fe-S cluster assembly protein [Eubacterium sp.]
MENTIKANRLPAMTWNWLKMNETLIASGGIRGEGTLNYSVPSDIKIEKASPEEEEILKNAETGMGPETSLLIAENVKEGLTIIADKGVKAAEPVRLRGEFAMLRAAVGCNIVAREDSEVVVISDMTGIKSLPYGAAVETRILVKDRAKVKLVEIYEADEESCVLDNIGAVVMDNAEFKLVQIFLGGKKIRAGAVAELKGYKAAFRCDTAYTVPQASDYDFNYVARQYGKDTVSEMYSNGVLYQDCIKCMRQTIDFKRGCSESKGAEREEVLLMDEKLENKTIPLILCQEEDVEGEHGASIGKLSGDILFYLRARGLTDEKIYKLMASGRMLSVASKIEDADTEKKVTELILGEEYLDGEK